MYKSKKNLGLSLVGILVALGLLSAFIVMFSSFFKSYYSAKHTIESSSKSLDISSSIIYDVFDSMGYLADNLGRGNCQNLNIEDVLTDLYRCVCTDEKCEKVKCPKVEGTKNFLTPILGITDDDFNVMSFTGGDKPKEIALSDKFSTVYAIKPQTRAQLEANGMPAEVLNRCFDDSSTALLPSARSNNIISQEKLNEMLEQYKEKALVQEYFTLITDIFKDEIKIANLYSDIQINIDNLGNKEDHNLRLPMLNYTRRTSENPNPQKTSADYWLEIKNRASDGGPTDSGRNAVWDINADFVIKCNEVISQNKRTDQDFTCNNYIPGNNIYSPRGSIQTPIYLPSQGIDLEAEYENIRKFLTSLKTKYSDHKELCEKIDGLITQFSLTQSTEQTQIDIDPDNLNINIDVLKQKTYTYLDRLTRLNQLLFDEGLKNKLDKHGSELATYTAKYNNGQEPFTTETFSIEKLYSIGKLCDTYSVQACFNIQDNNSNTDFLAGSNPRVVDSDQNPIDCYSSDNVNNPACQNRSSVILEVKAYPVVIDSDSPTEENIQFYKYNDSGSLNRLLKMVYILHWTKNIDGKYKYFRTSGAFTMATTPNLRK